MKRYPSRIKWKQAIIVLLLILAAYLIYVAAFGILPYASSPKDDEQLAQNMKVQDYYGNEQYGVDRVALIEASREGMDMRLQLIHSAKKTLSISYYATHWGTSTEMFISALLDAADRGVKIQFLIDGVAHHLSGKAQDAAYALSHHPNIELKFYNPMHLLKPWTFNGRLHDKYIIVDNQLLLLGGRNIGDKYFEPEGFSKLASLDRDVLVYNTDHLNPNSNSSVIYSVKDYFDLIWSLETNTVAHPSLSASKQERARAETARLLEAYSQLKQRTPHLLANDINYTEITVPTHKISFIHNPVHRGEKVPLLWQQISFLLQQAKETVTIQSPYVVLNNSMMETLQEISSDVGSFNLLTNSMATSPNPVAYSGYIIDRKKLLSIGTSIYEYQGEHSIHGKSYLIDNELSMVGSYNLDPRSTYINTEVMLVIHGEQFYDILEDRIAVYQAASVHINGPNGTEDEKEMTELKVPLWKRIFVQTLAVFAPLFKFLI